MIKNPTFVGFFIFNSEIMYNITVNKVRTINMFDKLHDILHEMYSKYGRGMFNILKSRKNKDISDSIYESTDEICGGRDISFSTRCYLIYHGMKDFPKCGNEKCNNRIIENINSFKDGFHEYCSVKCVSESPITKKKISNTKKTKYGCTYFNNYEKSKKTNLRKYGVEHTFQSENNKEKSKKTKLERYGDENYINTEKMMKTNMERYGYTTPLNNTDIKEKRDKTMMERYGVKYTFESDELTEKVKDTCEELYGDREYHNDKKARETRLERYGDEYFNNREKSKNTCLERYGVDSYTKTEEFKERIKEGSLERYGVDSFMKTDEFKRKSSETLMSRYGCDYYSQTDESREKMSIWHDTIFYNRLKACDIIEPLFSFDEFRKRKSENFDGLKWRCKRCGNEFYSDIDHQYAQYYGFRSYVRCIKCDSHKRCKSDGELEMFEYIKSICGNDIISGSRKVIFPKEIDIYIDRLKTGIEYDGLYWHSEYNGISKDDMMYKTMLCEDKGIRLIHIFSDEWRDNKEFCRDILKILLCNKKNNFDDVRIIDCDNYRVIKNENETIGYYSISRDGRSIEDIFLSNEDMNRRNLEIIKKVEKERGNDVNRFLLDMRFYSSCFLKSVFVDCKYIDQKKWYVQFNKDIKTRNKINGKFVSVIWDCGYTEIII